ncbi:hypothetical protein C5C18_00410 [Rathayibacter tritici]|nr:hypothetical protein [Rathayibacter tritici]PPF28826.1 hypothetical protein C5C06_07500 [Rathayibacter tritici]PPF67924.1 hypothetical protein C5C21_06160 [Rathayibacter tritici]PPG09484.1 hypothetical protein C5C18_00410 [Rathayibacter tritici]PPI13371.1 hypothetical protein C5D07_09905 [Rathayibacter tritici]PPI43227.1 hypothetical protein C5D18_10115 [Rathayibacter tritici]
MPRTPLGLRVPSRARRRLVATGAGTVLVLCAALAAPLSASAAYNPSDYPSWSDVEAAKSSESATAAEVDRITAFLADLRDQAAALTDAAISRAAEADAAQSALDEATQRVSALEERASAARSDADSAKEQAGRLAAQLYRNGGTDATLNLLIGGEQSSQLLYRLGTMTQLTQQTSRLQTAAQSTENQAVSLAAQAEKARSERVSLATAAADALSAARSAQADADAKVAEQEKYSQELYIQLASLKNTTAEVEKEYADGQDAKSAFEEQQRLSRLAAEAEAARQLAASAPAAGTAPAAPSGGGGGGAVELGDDDPTGARNSSAKTIGALGSYTGRSDGLSPAEAQAYARTAVGRFGWGSDQVDRCLIPLWNGESGWRWNALNVSSGAYGIPQALPASKMANSGADYQTNAATQIDWGLSYIKNSYGSPCNAWSSWNSRSPHWY